MPHPFVDLIKAMSEFAPDVEMLGGGPSEEDLPFGFVEVHGNRPLVRDYLSTPNPSRSHSIAARLWDQDLEYFKQVGLPLADGPEFASLSQYNLANAVTEHWGMGRAILYEGRYGWKAQFPDSLLPDLEVPVELFLFNTHFAVVLYQSKLYQDDDLLNDPRDKHPFIPGWLVKESLKRAEKAKETKGKKKKDRSGYRTKKRRHRNAAGILVW